jgi:hypothetical protein
MPSVINLNLSNVINVSVLGAPAGLGAPNINTLALFTSETPSPVFSGDYKVYTNPTAVATDFGSDSEAFAQATAIFSQVPNILSTGGYLVIIPLGAAETVKDAIIRTIDQVYYFGILVDQAISEEVFTVLAAYVQCIDKMLFYGSNTTADIESAGMLDDVRTANQTHVRCLYSTLGADDARILAAAYAARGLSTDFAGSNTTQTLHLKSLAGISPDTGIDQTALTKTIAAGVDVYVSIAGVSGVFSSGGNGFFDEIYNELWFKFALQTALRKR